MNSERRHELQQNYLADFLGTQLRKIENYTKLIAVVIAVVVIAAVAWGLYHSAAIGARSDATLELMQNSASGDPEALGQVGDRYSGTTAGALAKLYQADILLAGGIGALFTDREEAQTQLAEALRRYNDAAQASDDVLISSRANLGLARTHESMGEIEQAISAYNRVVSIGESEAMIQAAQQRIAALKNPETQEFFVWFDKQDFTPADPSQPPALPSGASLPDLPDLDLPDVSPLNVPDELRGEASDAPAPGQLNLPQGEPADTPPAQLDDAAEPATDPAAPVTESGTEPAAEPAATEPEPASEPAEPTAEPTTEPAVEPASDPAESATEPADQPVEEPAAEPAQPAAEPVDEAETPE